MHQVGLVGKPNVGKTTFFAAATLAEAKIAPYPFTTIDSNRGIAYVKVRCVCRDFGVVDNPRNSLCINGFRFVPVELIDVAGLVPGAWEGRGLGNRFLDELRRAPVLIHVVDASGSTDIEGRPISLGEHNPVEDVIFLEKEIDMWMKSILKRNWREIVRKSYKNVIEAFYEKLSGLGIARSCIEEALNNLDLAKKKLDVWNDDDILSFVRYIRGKAKPMVIAANKADLPTAEDYIRELKRKFPNLVVIPTAAAAELALRKAAKAKLIEYIPGDKDFRIIDEKKLTEKQMKALEYIRENVLKRWGSTGVQDAINAAFLKLLRMIVVFPVEDENKLTDRKGNVLPDAFLVPNSTTARDLAYLIHSELGDKYIGALDVKTKRRYPTESPLYHRQVIKILVRR
ncbi:MAG: redox-regulated ATPase YchF [Thermoprotei archaeon]|nr:MAG: redox-regulated ATPase YchF [Thermofilum sp. ex4484_79]RLE61268.1 MAG: redox-regulated ATPase YchF [Thermoprotei archaeon]HDD63857.1 redox-regulated ATPase YchF [Thermoprotei archaeon]